MGPIVILDKSTFQSLSYREHIFLDKHFKENLTPILCMELLGDLSKYKSNTHSGKQKVVELSRKFSGSGPVTNLNYQTLCVNSLLGQKFPMDGRIIPDNYTAVRSSDGTNGGIIDLGPFNKSIMRWSAGNFQEFELMLSNYWRKITKNLNLSDFIDQLKKNYVIIPKVKNKKEITQVLNKLIDNTNLQDVWFKWILSQMYVDKKCFIAIEQRWSRSRQIYLEYFAPYAWYCTKAMLTLIIATQSNLIGWKSTNLLDIQYLYYLPFCMVFISNDKLHQYLVPLLLRNDQMFVSGKELKKDLKRIMNEWENFTEKQKWLLSYALGSYPIPNKKSIIYKLCKHYRGPWSPGRGNLAVELKDSEKEEANEWVTKMFEDVEGKYYPFQDILDGLS